MFSKVFKSRRLASAGVALAATAGIALVSAPQAMADTAIVVSGSTKSGAYNNCVSTSRGYISSWTKVTVSCYYSGYAGGKYWYTFHYRSI